MCYNTLMTVMKVVLFSQEKLEKADLLSNYTTSVELHSEVYHRSGTGLFVSLSNSEVSKYKVHKNQTKQNRILEGETLVNCRITV